jgi:hypothetical protein
VPRYFFHLRDHTDEALDPDGKEMGIDAVGAVAMLAARDCIAGDVKSGTVDLRYRIDVHDETGALIHRLPFADAVAIIAPA